VIESHLTEQFVWRGFQKPEVRDAISERTERDGESEFGGEEDEEFQIELLLFGVQSANDRSNLDETKAN
jgi:hypothetical protein